MHPKLNKYGISPAYPLRRDILNDYSSTFFSMNSSSRPGSPVGAARHSLSVGHFLRQVESHHVQTPNNTPIPLHYDSKSAAMVVFQWCVERMLFLGLFLLLRGSVHVSRPFDPETQTRVPPNGLEAYRRTHYFKAPCCLCAFVENRNYSEARIGIVESFNGNEDRNRSVLHGEYVATCAAQACGYFRE